MFKNKILIAVVVLLVLIAAGLAKVKLSKRGSVTSDLATFEVKRGPLTISVVESGTIKAREQIIIKNEVEGRTSLIYLIPEGTVVKKGEMLVQLDGSTLEDNKIDQEIKVQNAEASYVNSKENLAVVENQAKSDVDLAELELEFARLDLKKYIEGDYPNELQKKESDITLAEEELTRARETLKWSEKLYEEKYISQTELQADQLSEKKRALDLEMAKTNLDLLTNFTHQRELAQRQSDVSQAEMKLERTNRKARANVVQAEADLKAKQAEYQRQQDKLAKIEEQIIKTRIYAPADGLVVYATSAQKGFRWNQEPLEEGQDVRERQELIYLPTANSSKAEITVHESNLEKIHTGMPAIITVDALPGKKFLGTVAHIAPLPDAQSMWMNPDLKVYTTEIYLEGSDSSLRTGMSCQAEIIVEQHKDVVYVPIQSVIRVKGEPTVYVEKEKGFEPTTVETGLDNNRMIHIINGLKAGEVVMLAPPLKAAASDSQTGSLMLQGEKPSDGSETIERQVVERLEEAKQRPHVEFETDSNDAQIEGGRKRKERPDRISSEQGEEMRRRFENMTPEEKERMRKRFEGMSPEERGKMRQRPREGQREN